MLPAVGEADAESRLSSAHSFTAPIERARHQMAAIEALLQVNLSTFFVRVGGRAPDTPVDDSAFAVTAHDPIDLEHGQSRSPSEF